MTDKTQFVHNLGFTEDPFALTNADDERRLPEYFVEPPFFPAVFGNADFPKPFFVFAPRGGGKTAQRIMIENRCRARNVLSLTYVDFDFFGISKAREVTLEDHVRRILRIGMLGILVEIYDQPALKDRLSRSEKSMLARLINRHLGNLKFSELNATLNSLKSLSDKIADFVNKYRVPLEAGASSLSQLVLGQDVVDVTESASTVDAFEPKYELELLVDFAKKIGFRSVYVLVDKVDETAYAGNKPLESFRIIEPLIRSLNILETHGIGFKFFLPIEMERLFRKVGRPDRTPYRKLEWRKNALMQLLSKRVKAFSDRRVSKLDSVSESLPSFGIDEIVVAFAQGSPRDLIRLCDHIITEQMELDSGSANLTVFGIYNGLESYCKYLGDELFSVQDLNSFRRIGNPAHQIDFTIRYLANNIFREKQASTRSRIKRWKDLGIISDLGRITSTTGNKVKLYGVKDIRLARIMAGQIDTKAFINEKLRSCPNCSEFFIRDFGQEDSNEICPFCGFDSTISDISPYFQPEADDDSDLVDNSPRQLSLPDYNE